MAKYELVPNQEQEAETNYEIIEKKSSAPAAVNNAGDSPSAVSTGWTTDGMPVGEPMMYRSQWETGLFSCLGKNDEFYSSDLEVCLLGTFVPCVLHGSNVERIGSTPGIFAGTFANNCLTYSGLFLIGNCFFGWNCLAPWFSYPNRTAIRHKFNLEGSYDTASRSFGYCGNYLTNYLTDEIQREKCEASCDFGTHVFCHPCALCQEAREVRRRIPHPGRAAQPMLVMIAPEGQAMGPVA